MFVAGSSLCNSTTDAHHAGTSGCCRFNKKKTNGEFVCSEGHGGCYSDEDCKDGLRCGRNNCGPAYKSKDCCMVDDNRCTAESHSWDCCTVDNTCAVGRGDCDSDDECDNGLVCGKNACGSGYRLGMDCCVKPTCTADVSIICKSQTLSKSQILLNNKYLL